MNQDHYEKLIIIMENKIKDFDSLPFHQNPKERNKAFRLRKIAEEMKNTIQTLSFYVEQDSLHELLDVYIDTFTKTIDAAYAGRGLPGVNIII